MCQSPQLKMFDSSMLWQEVATTLSRQEDQDRQHAPLDGDAGARGCVCTPRNGIPEKLDGKGERAESRFLLMANGPPTA